MKHKSFLFYFIWFSIILISSFSIISGPYFLGFKKILPLLNFIQRVSALILLPLIAFQIFLGSSMTRLTEKLGGWVLRFHFRQGIIIALLIFIHPITLLVQNFIATHKFNPFYVFTDFCLLCPIKLEFYYSLGRIGFWLILIAVIAAKLRNWDWWRQNWRYFHILNYFAFFFVSVHGFFVGTDTKSNIYLPLFFVSIALVVFSITTRIYRFVKKR